jgi:DsbC/DsbD-like thiol-disulfide interchange protein
MLMKAAMFAAAILPFAAAAQLQFADAIWIPETNTVTEGKAVRTVVNMTVEEDWHTYWENPGVAGLPVSIKAELPEGWSVGGIQFPVPKRFDTGGLAGFGYEGGALFPLTLTPPSGFSGDIPDLNISVSWLTCNDSSCVPGEQELTLPAKADAELVASAYNALPKQIPGAKLAIATGGKGVIFTLSLPESSDFDPAAFEIFPATRNILDPAATPQFAKQPDSSTWTATAPKDEYLDGEPKEFAIVLYSPGKGAWKISAGQTTPE